MIGGVSIAGEFVSPSVRLGVPNHATEEAFSGFLANWKRLDEKAPKDDSWNPYSNAQDLTLDRTSPPVSSASKEIDIPVSTFSSKIDSVLVGNAPRTLPTENLLSSGPRTASGHLPSLKLDIQSPVAEVDSVTSVTRDGSRTEYPDPLLRFEWRRTAVAGLWSSEGLSLTLRDFGIEDSDGERLLSALRSMLGDQGDALNRLTVNGKKLFQR